ncbi:hypothetical protein [Streptomyces sp. NPDC088794]|uniref:hypothetical protein n=1 Tax=Streptomyces sp. NPDC088794 TaxID=3365902 RepID=UPI0037FF3E09
MSADMAAPRLRLSNADGDSWDDPSEEQIDRHYSRLNLRHRLLVLDRLDVPAAEAGEHYLQLALNDDFSYFSAGRRVARDGVAGWSGCGGIQRGSGRGVLSGAGIPAEVQAGTPRGWYLCLTCVTPGVFSPARLARALRHMADCRSCSVEC